MDAFGIIAIILAVVGVLGGFLPVIPGPAMSWLGLLFVYLSDKADGELTLAAIIIWLLATIAISIADFILPGVMTRLTGGHKAGERGALVGLIVGFFFTPVGMILGSFLGAFLGEYLAERQNFATSLKSACGAFLAFILSTGLKVIFSVILLWVVVAHLIH